MTQEFRINKCEFEYIQLTNCNIVIFCALSTLFLAIGLHSVDGLDNIIMSAIFALLTWNNMVKRKRVISDVFGINIGGYFFSGLGSKRNAKAK